jgi:aspartate racemase
MIGILGGMGTQAGLDFCNKLAILYRGKLIKNILYFYFIINQIFLEDLSLLEFKLKNLSNRFTNKKSKKKYSLVLKSLLNGCKVT